jgi:hypothetical protein
MSVRRIVPLTVGWERLPKSYSVHGDDSGDVSSSPCRRSRWTPTTAGRSSTPA